MTPDDINRWLALDKSADDFAQRYAARSDIDVEQLRWLGRYPQWCSCGDEMCQGWVMGHQHEDALIENEMRDKLAGATIDKLRDLFAECTALGIEIPHELPIDTARHRLAACQYLGLLIHRKRNGLDG